jgi:hypothetical protein
MPLPAPASRQHLHTRSITYRGFLRDDGLWDIEGELVDAKPYAFDMMERGHLEPGTPVHGLQIRVTVDDRMKIHAIATSMDFTPYGECRRGADPMQRMVGHSMGPGWRQTIERELGGIKGCTHLRELLFNLATATYQTVFPYRERQREQSGARADSADKPPYHLGRCIAWDFDGPVVKKVYPQFAGWQPLRKSEKAPPR